MKIVLDEPIDSQFKIQINDIKSNEIIDVTIPEVWSIKEDMFRMEPGDNMVGFGFFNQFVLIGQHKNTATFVFYDLIDGIGTPLNCFTTRLDGDANVSE